jgi:hypothetical protein
MRFRDNLLLSRTMARSTVMPYGTTSSTFRSTASQLRRLLWTCRVHLFGCGPAGLDWREKTAECDCIGLVTRDDLCRAARRNPRIHDKRPAIMVAEKRKHFGVIRGARSGIRVGKMQEGEPRAIEPARQMAIGLDRIRIADIVVVGEWRQSEPDARKRHHLSDSSNDLSKKLGPPLASHRTCRCDDWLLLTETGE